MATTTARHHQLTDRTAALLLGVAMLLYVVLFSTIAAWKFNNFRYNALDLAIFTQTVSRSSTGDFFGTSIHPPTYLVDHFSPLLLGLALPYRLFPHPLTLLIFLQVGLAAGALAVYRLARNWLSPLAALAVGISYLLNPFTQNLSLFEFHFLAFAVPILLFAADAYQRQRFSSFLAWSTAALLVREDVALVVGSFGVLAAIQRRPWRWVLAPLLGSVAWFGASMKIISAASPAGSYKFGIYYAWLGKNLPEIFSTVLLQPWRVVQHLLRLGNLELVLGMLLPFSFVPLLAPLPLLLAFVPLLQITLGIPGGSDLILKTQYSALFLPALWLSFCTALPRMLAPSKNTRRFGWLWRDRRLTIAIVAAAVVYGSLTLGPLPGTLTLMGHSGDARTVNEHRAALLERVAPDAPIAASYAYLSRIAGRAQVSSLNNAFIGRQQLSKLPYELPTDTQYILFDLNDLLTFQLQYQRHILFYDDYPHAARRLNERMELDGFTATTLAEGTILFQRQGTPILPLYQLHNTLPVIARGTTQAFGTSLIFLGFAPGQTAPGPWPAAEQLPLRLFWQKTGAVPVPYYFRLASNGTPVSGLYPLSAGVLPIPDWPVGSIIETRHWLKLPTLPAATPLELELITVSDGGLYLTPDRSTEVRVTHSALLGPPIPLGTLSELIKN